jgi:hypothetical protein
MRAQEFIVEWNLRKPKDYGKAHRDGLDLEYFIGSGPGAGTLTINAKSSGGTTLGQVTFKEYGNRQLEALDLWVDEEVRGQGIAAIMYDWVKELGYTIERSNAQTDAGKHFWDKNRGEEGCVWEDQLDEISPERLERYLAHADKQVSTRMDRMMRARERLNKSWEIYDHNNPTRIIDRFEANTPAEAQRYYQNFIDNYNPGDENFEFYLRRSTGIWEQQELNEIGDTRTDYEPNRRRKRSLFHATVDGYWVDVHFDRSFTGTLQITFTVNQNYEPRQHRKIDQGTVFRIFSAVQQIIKERLPEYMRTARPPRVTFTAKGDSRVKLYRRMFVPLVTEILGPKWQLSEHPGELYLFVWEPVKKQQGVAEGYSNTTFQIDRRRLNVPALIKAGALFVTYPHGEQGWETDNQEDWAYSLISLYNVMKGGWPSEAKKYLKPASYKRAEQQVNSSAPNLGSDQLVYDGKYNQILWSIKKLGIPDNVAFLDNGKQGVAEGFPQPGESSGKAKQFNPNAKVQTKEMTLDQILATVKGIPYVNNVVDDWDAKDYSWGVTKKVIEYAQYLQKNPQSVANLPPLVVIDGQLNDGAHRLSAINLLQKRMDPKNPLWKQVKLKVNFGTSADVAPEQGVAEGSKNNSTIAQKIFFARSDKTPKGWSYDHVGFITQDGRQIQMSGHKGNDVYVTNDVTDDPEFPKQNIKIVSLSKPVSVPTTNTVGAENCGTFVANVLQANGIKGIDTQKIYSMFKKPQEQGVAEGKI